MGFQPFLLPEKRAKRQSDLPMLVAFRAGRERAGISQDVAAVLDKLCLAVERMIYHQFTSNRRHDATYIVRGRRDAGGSVILPPRIPDSPLNIAHFRNFS
jgi:hypothetical protein